MLRMHGYDLEEINTAAEEVLNTISELSIPQPLAILALCRAIVNLGTEYDLNVACKIIDDMAELPKIKEEYEYDTDRDAGDEDQSGW